MKLNFTEQVKMKSELRAIYGNAKEDIDTLCAKHGLRGRAFEIFEERVVREFKEATQRQVSEIVLRFMRAEFRNQEQRAKCVGVDRTTWSRHESSGVLPYQHLTYLLEEFRITVPPSKELGRRAATETVTFIRNRLQPESVDCVPLTREECEFLFQMLADSAWLEANQTADVHGLRKSFHILRERVNGSEWITTRIVSTFWYMQHLFAVWADFFVIGCYMIPWSAE
jgi:hypothetical protein